MMIEEALKLLLSLQDGAVKDQFKALGIGWKSGRRWLNAMAENGMVELYYKRIEGSRKAILMVNKKYVIGIIPKEENK
jgi:hypothetical protein